MVLLSLDRVEIVVLVVVLEIIDRVGLVEVRIKVFCIEDVRVIKRKYIIERVKEIFEILME